MPKLCIALDTEYENALRLVKALRGKDITFKVGYKLFISHHRRITEPIKEEGFELFLDLKLHDIPSTVQNGVLSAKELGADYLTVHITSGRDALLRAVEVSDGLKLLGVSLLTSLEEEHLKDFGVCLSKEEYVLRLASIALECGITGLVCSGKELPLLKSRFNFFAVVPSVRLRQEEREDQRRVVSLEEAIRNGADMVVLGRSILRSQDPVKTVEYILALLQTHP